MVTAWVVLLGLAHAEDASHELTWTIAVDGQAVGERTLSVRYVSSDSGRRRVMQGWTELSVAGFEWKQRLTASADTGPASFHAVMDEAGRPREVQGRLTPTGWRVSVVDAGRSRTWTLGGEEVQLSTVDFLDPEARTPITRLDHAKVLVADTGAVSEGPVERLGPSDITIAGTQIPVEGYAWTADGLRTELFYTSEGYLVRMTGKLAGKNVTAELKAPPPTGLDDQPVMVGGPGISETPL